MCRPPQVPLCSFSWEEVGAWSGLSSPRVLQLFGAVREGPNIILFMDLKTGEHSGTAQKCHMEREGEGEGEGER